MITYFKDILCNIYCNIFLQLFVYLYSYLHLAKLPPNREEYWKLDIVFWKSDPGWDNKNSDLDTFQKLCQDKWDQKIQKNKASLGAHPAYLGNKLNLVNSQWVSRR